MASKQTNEDEDEPLFNFKTKSDSEQFNFMIQKSETARQCISDFESGQLLDHAMGIIELVKIGYSRDEMRSFLSVIYNRKDERIRIIEETLGALYD